MKIRPPGWMSWFALIWLSCVLMPTRNGKMRLNLLVALVSGTYGAMGLDVGLGLWARQTCWGYWDPWQLLGGCCTGSLFGAAGSLFGAFMGQWGYQVVRAAPETSAAPPTQDAYPTDPRRESKKILLPPRERGKTVFRPIWWRIVLLIALSIWVWPASGGTLLAALTMPRMALAPVQVAAERVPDWTTVSLEDGFEVDMPGKPGHQGEWLYFENADGRFGVSRAALSQDDAAWRWQLWGGALSQVRPLSALHSCHQAGLDGIDFRSGEMSTRLLLGRNRVYTLSVVTREGDWQGAAFLNSFRPISASSQRPFGP